MPCVLTLHVIDLRLLLLLVLVVGGAALSFLAFVTGGAMSLTQTISSPPNLLRGYHIRHIKVDYMRYHNTTVVHSLAHVTLQTR